VFPPSRLAPHYENSYAVVVGIDKYLVAAPLAYAVSDALAIAKALGSFGFSEDKICVLTDAQATRFGILRSYLKLCVGGSNTNDRVVFFFAGHGHTERSRRGEVGFLVPHDGDPQDLSSLVRWDELTRNADLIAAKHLLYLMDACYGGLALTRALKPGSMRFLKDMLLRPTRQVLTAGKADEVVADLGGPLPNHSVFTGHLLEGLGGNAATADGLITANGLMAYVYQKVGQDSTSRQTPHYGYLDGDGDMILSAPQLTHLQQDEKEDKDILVTVPAVLLGENGDHEMSISARAKQLLADDRDKIRLHDLVTSETRTALSLSAEDHFPVQGQWSPQEFHERLTKYEDVIARLRDCEILLGYWGSEAHRELCSLPLKRFAGRLTAQSGLSVWIELRWYPIMVMLYAGGIAAVAAGKYENLRSLFQAKVQDPERSRKQANILYATFSQMNRVLEAFKSLPGHDSNYTPRSEYLFKLLQPPLDDLLFLGSDYEASFDTFEVLLALEYAVQAGRSWGPVGRFGWKFSRGDESSPFHGLVADAEAQGTSWPPARAGLVGGSVDRVKEIASQYSKGLANLGWY
jgi:uncharacterized caspase-like protein